MLLTTVANERAQHAPSDPARSSRTYSHRSPPCLSTPPPPGPYPGAQGCKARLYADARRGTPSADVRRRRTPRAARRRCPRPCERAHRRAGAAGRWIGGIGRRGGAREEEAWERVPRHDYLSAPSSTLFPEECRAMFLVSSICKAWQQKPWLDAKGSNLFQISVCTCIYLDKDQMPKLELVNRTSDVHVLPP